MLLMWHVNISTYFKQKISRENINKIWYWNLIRHELKWFEDFTRWIKFKIGRGIKSGNRMEEGSQK